MQFEKAYKQLNPEQKVAVDEIDGPMLVIAGPGTGKTQLLSARVANILDKTDTLPQSILCLTFTESAARNMRDRLANFIGKEAYDVFISTYHNFGSDIIRSYPEFFEQTRLEKPIDDLGKKQVLSDIVAKLPYSSPLKAAQYKIYDLVSTISELKRSLMTPEDLRQQAAINLAQIDRISPKIAKITADVDRFPSTFKDAGPLFSKILKVLEAEKDVSLVALAKSQLKEALIDAEEINKSSPLTKWKNSWLVKDSSDKFVFTQKRLSSKLVDLADVLEKYAVALEKRGLYDFDDMILRSIEAIRTNPELKFNLQERYLYVLLDEFQDTNAAQFEIVKLLSDNPVHESRPNVMAVGDDDQAIYAFQGAEISNMVAFSNTYRDVRTVNLTKNYRSHHEILHTAHNIAEQIETRLHHNIEGVEKTLEAAADGMPKEATIARHEFVGPNEEYAWIASRIGVLIEGGADPNEIVVLAPKHKYLEAAVTYLNSKDIAVTYEKRENILETPIVTKLRLMVELLVSIADNNPARTNQLMPRVLSFDFYQIPVQDIWKINWQHSKRDETRGWSEIAAESDILKNWVWFYLGLANQLSEHTLEGILDILIGSEQLELTGIEKPLESPLRSFHFSTEAKDRMPLSYYETLSHLSVIRTKLRDWQAGQDKQLTLAQFIEFFEMYEEAEESLINTHPIAQAKNSVKLMTVYKAKGLEFEHVFILGCSDEIWGTKARNNSNKIALAQNLRHIRYAGTTEDERLRLLFVAITRAKQHLYLTSHATDNGGKDTIRLKFFDENESEEGGITSGVLPNRAQKVEKTTQDKLSAKQDSIELGWHARHVLIEPKLKDLLSQRLERYQLSPTHLNTFIDLEWGGPEKFLLNTLLRFPQAPTVSSEFGSAIHSTLDWYQQQVIKGNTPTIKQVNQQYHKLIDASYIPFDEIKLLKERGETALGAYLAVRGETIGKDDVSEMDFRSEGVLIGDAHLSGKIDHMEIDKKNKTIVVVDYKTGKSYKRLDSSIKLHKYKQQLYCYKLLIENSHTYAGYKVESARLEFIEPDENGDINFIEFKFDEAEMKHIKKLIQAVWARIINLDLPDTTGYKVSMPGVRQFEKDLI